MSESDQNVIKFPENTKEIKLDNNFPQGFAEFYNSLQQAIAYAFQAAAPFKNKSPVLEQTFGELLRYMELVTMYMDRYVLYIKNPHLLHKPESNDAQTEKAD